MSKLSYVCWRECFISSACSINIYWIRSKIFPNFQCWLYSFEVLYSDNNESFGTLLSMTLFRLYIVFESFQAINEKLDMSEKKLIEFASMPDIEEQLRDRMEALTQAQERQGTAEDRIQRLECQLVRQLLQPRQIYAEIELTYWQPRPLGGKAPCLSS